jgi:glycerophosphoryl diester phosphodiesterase
LLIPINIAPWLWGYPGRLAARLHSAGTQYFIVGRYLGGDFSSGIDDEQLLARLPADFGGGIWTNRIELIGPLVRRVTAEAQHRPR